MTTFKQGDTVLTSEELYPFYWNYAGNPSVVIPVGSIGVVTHPKAQGDIIIDFPIDVTGLSNTVCDTLPVPKVWRVRMKLAKDKYKQDSTCLTKVACPDWLKFHFFCGGLMLDCEMPRLFNRGEQV